MNALASAGGVWGNPVLWLPIFAGVIVQAFKLLTFWRRYRRIDFRILVQTGGMPSSHSAVVTALATAVGIREGTGSTLFAMACILAAVVMYDAAGVRRAAGKQAAVLNRILEDMYQGQPVAEERLRELLGHTPFEVIVGAAVGAGIAWAWLTLF